MSKSNTNRRKVRSSAVFGFPKSFDLSHIQNMYVRSGLIEHWLNARSWGANTPMKMCIQADLDSTGALRHMNKNNSKRPVCTTRTSLPLPTFFVSRKGSTFLVAFSAWNRRAGTRWRWQPMSLHRLPRIKSFRARTRAISRSLTIPRTPTTARGSTSW